MKTTVLALGMLLPGIALAVPPTLTHSGRLLDSTGVPVQGSHDLTVTLYDAATGGNSLWSDTLTTQIDEGYFSVALGDAADPIDASVVDKPAVWVEVQVDSGTPLPRQPLYSVPYAALADQVVGTTGTFSPTVELQNGNCVGSANTTHTASGTYHRIGDLVYISITNLPTGATHSQYCILRIKGLPFPAAAAAAFSIGHSRGIKFRYNASIHTDFTMSAEIDPSSTTIVTHTAYSGSPFSGFWYLDGPDSGTYVHSVSGTYLAAP